jgi:hypothetical protein
MAITSRGKRALAGLGILALLGVGAFAFSGRAPEPIRRAVQAVTGDEPEPPTCPLTGEPTSDGRAVPDRPMLAVKVENTDAAYPLAGLDRADLVYEEIVEGGITRFVALFHCREAERIGPVRSARTTDPKILGPFQDRPVLAYSGAARKVVKHLQEARIIELTEASAPSAFERDAARVSPHNLFTATGRLWAAARKAGARGTPTPVFEVSEEPLRGARKAREVRIVFSPLSETGWVWRRDGWTRLLEGAPMTLENGRPIVAANVVIQIVRVRQDTIIDASGAPSPLVEMTGTGRAWVLRDGRAIRATWERADEGDPTVFRTKDGEPIALAPGVTWVELVPTTGEVTLGR